MTTQPTEQSLQRRKNECLTTAVLSLNSAIAEIEKLRVFVGDTSEQDMVYQTMIAGLKLMRGLLHAEQK